MHTASLIKCKLNESIYVNVNMKVQVLHHTFSFTGKKVLFTADTAAAELATQGVLSVLEITLYWPL